MNLKVYLAVSWIIVIGVTLYAVATLGLNWPQYFFGDMLDNAWRAQFNIDFLLHIVLLIIWIIWREASRTTGIVCALLSSVAGMFTLLYLLHRFHQADGNVKRFLLGKHA